MKSIYNTEISKFTTIEQLPDAWTKQDYLSLLDALEYDGVEDLQDSDIKEMCLMAITDNEPNEAAKIVLEYIFKNKLNKGQIDNLSHEMLDEKLWEEYADLSMHEAFFNVNQILYDAYNGKFPHPEAVQFEVKITSKNKNNISILTKDTEALIIKVLVNGMPENTLIKRLFKSQLEGNFKEAKDIIWQLKIISETETTIIFDLISSAYWFHDLKFADAFTAELNIEPHIN